MNSQQWPDVHSMLTYSIGETIDSLLRIDLRGYRTPQILYDAARSLTDKPLSIDAASRLVSAIKPGDTVFLCTGFVFPPWGTGEHDGLSGTVILARALEEALGAHPVIVVDDLLVPVLGRMLRIGGLMPFPTIEEARTKPRGAWVTGFPKDTAEAKARAASLIEACRPRAGIAIERPGLNARGHYHLASGIQCTEWVAKLDYLFLGLQEAHITTIGIGDNGNELGLGNIAESIRRLMPYGDRCTCPCQGGVAAAVGSDAIVTAGVSEWGAYGLAAAVAFLAGKHQALVPSEVLERLQWAAIENGIIDGTGYAVTEVDGVRLDYNRRLIDMLHDLLDYTRRAPEKYAGRFTAVLERTGTKADP